MEKMQLKKATRKQVGIYKITSPSGRVYIGQSVDIDERFRRYKLLQNCNEQFKLYNSFLKYGVVNHSFDVIETCDVELLNRRERFWQDEFDVIKNGLNCKLTQTEDKSGFYCDEVKAKLSLSKQGVFNGGNNPMFGKKHSEKSKELIRQKALGRRLTENHKSKISEGLKKSGYKISDEHKEKLRKLKTGVNLTDSQKEKISKTRKERQIPAPNKIQILDSYTGFFYESIKEASEITGVRKNRIQYQIHKPNNRFLK